MGARDPGRLRAVDRRLGGAAPAALPAIVGGLLLSVGMYAQPNLAFMYTAIAVGTLLLVLDYATSLRRVKGEAQ
jgi:hypothetical protein